MKAHKKDMVAAWARENGIKGYEQLDPQIQAKRRQEAITQSNNRRREYNKDNEFKRQ